MVSGSGLGFRIKLGKNTTIGFSADEMQSLIDSSGGVLDENSTLVDMKEYIFKKCEALTNKMLVEKRHKQIIEDIQNGKKEKSV